MTRLPPPEQWALVKMDEMELAELIEQHIDFYTVESDTRRSPLQVDDGCKKPTATSLYTVDPLDPNHDATMRIEGEAPKQQQPILFPGAKTMGGRRATATSDRFLAVSSLCAPRCQNFVFLLPSCCRLRR